LAARNQYPNFVSEISLATSISAPSKTGVLLVIGPDPDTQRYTFARGTSESFSVRKIRQFEAELAL
jgi:hypothetical protein